MKEFPLRTYGLVCMFHFKNHMEDFLRKLGESLAKTWRKIAFP